MFILLFFFNSFLLKMPMKFIGWDVCTWIFMNEYVHKAWKNRYYACAGSKEISIKRNELLLQCEKSHMKKEKNSSQFLHVQ